MEHGTGLLAGARTAERNDEMAQRFEEKESAETEMGAELTVEQCERMRLLIGELVETNQELRFKVARLKQRISRLEKGLPDEIPWAGMLI
jgi:regulator of replication initiation timing